MLKEGERTLDQLVQATNATPVLLSKSSNTKAWKLLVIIFLRPSFAQLGRLWSCEGSWREIFFVFDVWTFRRSRVCRWTCKLVCLRYPLIIT